MITTGVFASQTETAPESSKPGPFVERVLPKRLAACSRYVAWNDPMTVEVELAGRIDGIADAAG